MANQECMLTACVKLSNFTHGTFLHTFSKPPFIAGVFLSVAGIAQTSLMFSYYTCLPAVSLEPTTVHKGTLDPMQHRT